MSDNYDWSDTYEGLGTTANAYPYYERVEVHVDCWGAQTCGWALVGALDDGISGQHTFTISADIRIYAYMSTGLFGHATIEIRLELINADNHAVLWTHSEWDSGDIGSLNTRTYSGYSPSIEATTDTSYGGNLLFCVKFIAHGAYGATICRSSSLTSTPAKVYIDQITWSY